MTAFEKSISNGVGFVGGGPASLWNAANWNAFTWGSSLFIPVDVMHFISDSLTPTEAVTNQDVMHFISAGSMTLSEDLTYEPDKLLGNSIAPTSNPDENLFDGAGYYYVFPSNTIDADSRDFPSYTSGSSPGSSWSSATAGSTTWS